MEFFRHILEKYSAHREQTENQTTPEQYRAEELGFAKEMISYIYISGQVNLTSLSNQLNTTTPSSGSAFDSTISQTCSSDQMTEIGIDRILETVGATPEERQTIRSQALQEAKDYWVDRLTQPNLEPNEIMLGHKRITQITEKLDNLNQPPPAPNLP